MPVCPVCRQAGDRQESATLINRLITMSLVTGEKITDIRVLKDIAREIRINILKMLTTFSLCVFVAKQLKK
jgi:hypothetical protein